MSNNNTSTTIITDAALTSILSHFETPYIIDLIKNAIDYKYRPYSAAPPTVNSIENHFKLALQYCEDPIQIEKITAAREETYKEIVNIICIKYNLSYNIEDKDLYSCAYYLFDFFVYKFTDNLCSFYINYIILNKDYIYDHLNLNLLKKNKDSATVYGKKLYDNNNKLAIIHANIINVLDDISTFDVPLEDLLYTAITDPKDKNISDFILSIIADNGNIFKDYFASLLANPNTRSDVITSVKLKLQEYATVNNLISNNV